MRKRWQFAVLTASAIGSAIATVIVFGLAEARAVPIERRANLTLTGLPPNAAPYRIALLSDIHFGNRAMQRARLDSIVLAVNAVKPNLIVIAGDFVNGHQGRIETDPNDLIAPLADLVAPDGVIATLGNHDHWTDPNGVSAALHQAGITVLSNQPVRRGPLLVLGIDDSYSNHANIVATDQAAAGLGGVPVAVTHSPDLSPSLPPEVDLLLAGHTHCGQVVLPAFGSLAPLFGKLIGDAHYYDARYECGLVREGRRTTIVTAGLGSGSLPLRIGAPPDWWLISLTPPKGR